MRTLYHWPLDPPSRQARLALGEKKLKFKLEPINPWSVSENYLALSPEGFPPTLVEATPDGRIVIAGARAICEYVEDSSARHPILGPTPKDRAEARRLCSWFDQKFSEEVNAYLLHEKVEKIVTGGGNPHTPTLRMGRDHLGFHLDYMTWMLEQRPWLAGHDFSLADIAAGANISCLDFLGEIPWKNWPRIKEWYQKLKSRPSFRPILADRVPGLTPPRHYADLDF